MKFKLEIDCDNDAMQDQRLVRIARAVRQAAEKLDNGQLGGIIRDDNGNTIGVYGLDVESVDILDDDGQPVT